MRAFLTISRWLSPLVLIIVGVLGGIGKGVSILIDTWHEFFRVCQAMTLSRWSFFTFPTNAGMMVLIALLSSGFIVMIGRVGRELVQLRMIQKKLSSKKYYERGSVTIIDQDSCAAFSIGFFRPRIYLSRHVVEQCSEEELRALLAHERYHVLHLHSWSRLCVHIFTSLFFFIPAVRTLATYFLVRQEFKADEAAIEVTSRRTLAQVLLRFHHKETSAITIAGFSTVAKRVERLMNPHSSAISTLSFSMFSLGLLSAVTLVTLLFSQVRPLKVAAEINASGETVRCSAILKESIAPQFILRDTRSSSVLPDRSSAFE